MLPYTACAVVYLALAGLILLQARRSRTGLLLAGAGLLTAGWAAAAAVTGRPLQGGAGGLDLLRSLAWYGFVLHLYRRALPQDPVSFRKTGGQAFATMGLVGLLATAAAVLLGVANLGREGAVSLLSAAILLRLALAICQLLLLENLYRGAGDQRWHVGLACVALGALAAYDVVLCADAVLFRMASPVLVMGRPVVACLVTPLLAVAAARNRAWRVDIHVSRAAAFHSATLVASGVFLLALAAAGEVVRQLGARLGPGWGGDGFGGPGWGGVAEISLVFAGVLTVAVLLTSGSARSALRRLLVDHFFTSRFDYRREWQHCLDILAATDRPDSSSLGARVIRAVADAVDSPAGLLFTREPGAALSWAGLSWAGSWNMRAAEPLPASHPLLARLEQADAVVLTPDVGLPDPLWLAVALRGPQGVAGAVLLARPRAPFRLDAEVFDLLRVLAREVATHLAEQRATRVLLETRDLRAYGERFAFVAHDIKNVSSQLSLLLSNAETHLENPDFQRDMLATIRASVARIGGLIRRLEPGATPAETDVANPAAILEQVAAGRRATGSLVSVVAQPNLRVRMPGPALEAAVTHLLDNALAAAGPAGQVRLVLRTQDANAVIDVEDDGPGMAAEFVRDRLFRPFDTSKPDGSGIGAFQARELTRGAGGELVALSTPGQGTVMRITLPLAADPLRVAAHLVMT